MGERDLLLYDFFELGDRHSFDCTDGSHCEGYALDVEETRVLFGFGGPMAPAEPSWIEYADISLTGLSYWDPEVRRWVDYP